MFPTPNYPWIRARRQKKIEDQPMLKNFNLNLILTWDTYKVDGIKENLDTYLGRERGLGWPGNTATRSMDPPTNLIHAPWTTAQTGPQTPPPPLYRPPIKRQ